MADIQPYRFVATKHDFTASLLNPWRCRCGRAKGYVMHRKPKK